MTAAKKIKVGIFFTFNTSLNDWYESGLITRELEIYKEMYLLGFEICFFTYGDQRDMLIKDKYNWFEVRVIPKVKTGYFVVDFFYSLISAIRISRSLKDIHLVKTNQMWGAWVALISSKIANLKLISRSGYEINRFSIFQNESPTKRTFKRILSRIVYKNSFKIHLPTDSDISYVARTFKINKNKFKKVPNYINTELFFQNISDIKDKKIDVLVVGRCSSQKNIDLIIKNIKDLNINACFVGMGYETIEKKVKNSKCNFKFTGPVPNETLNLIYNEAKIYLIASNYEGNPKSLLEAMACSCCVIGANSEGINNIIKNQENGYLINLNEQNTIKKTIKKIINNHQEMSLMGHNASKFIESNFSLKKIKFIEKESYDQAVK